MDNGASVFDVGTPLQMKNGGGALGVGNASAVASADRTLCVGGKSFKMENGKGVQRVDKMLKMKNGDGALGVDKAALKVENGNKALALDKVLKVDKRDEVLCANKVAKVENGDKVLHMKEASKKTNKGGEALGRYEVANANKVEQVLRKDKVQKNIGKAPNAAKAGTVLGRDVASGPDGARGPGEEDQVCHLDTLDKLCELDESGPLAQVLPDGVLGKLRCGRSFAMARSGRALVALDHVGQFGYAGVPDAIVDVLALPPPAGTGTTDAATSPEPEARSYTEAAPPPAEALVAVVFESGRVDFWRSDARQRQQHQRYDVSPAGRADLCISPRARVLAAAAFSSCLLWCEARASSAPRSSRDLLLRHCVCRRAVLLQADGGAALGGVQVLLHGCPALHVVPSADVVHLVPFRGNPASLQSLLLLWSPRDDSVSALALRRGGVVCEKRPGSDADFKGLALGCSGPPPAGKPPVAHCACPGGGLLLGLSDGRVWRVERDGQCRVLCRCGLLRRGGGPAEMLAVKRALAVAAGKDVEIFDTQSGHLIKKIKRDVCILSVMSNGDEDGFRLLTDGGIYQADTEPAQSRGTGSLRPQDVLSDWIYEKACKYYQKRSLTGNQIIPEQLKHSGAGKRAASVVAILSRAVCPKNSNSKAAPVSVNLENALKPLIENYVKIEQIKRTFVLADEEEIQYSEFVKEEVCRLLQGRDTDTPKQFQSLLDKFLDETLSAVWDVLGLNDAAVAAGGGPNDPWRCVMQDSADPDAVPPVYEQLCTALYQHRPDELLSFVGAAQESQRAVPRSRLSSDSAATPPHLRALFVLPESGGEAAAFIRTELLCRGSPEDAAQAIQLLLSMGMWQQAVAAASRYRIDNQLLQAQVFTTFLDAFTCSRGLDPYVAKVWELCPDSMTATDVLATVLHNLPNSHEETQPFGRGDVQVTIELLRPLLTRLLLKESARFEM